jgi:hypothetical protein
LHETIRCVIAARSFAGVAGEFGEGKAGAVGVDLGCECKQGRVDSAKFFRAKVFVVDGAQQFAFGGEGEVADGIEEVGVGEGTGRE